MTADAELWDRELAERAPRAPLLQSWGWGEVQSRAGWSVERLRISPGGAMASLQIRKVGLAREVYVPRGPLPATIEAIDGLVKWARRSRVAKIVVEPEASKDLRDPLKERGFTRTSPTQPQHTRIIKLLPPEKLLTTFRHGRRYNIDLWGVAPPGAGPDHPWYGLGFFKSEFGGEEVAYAGSWELVLSTVGARLLSAERKTRAYIRGLKRNIP